MTWQSMLDQVSSSSTGSSNICFSICSDLINGAAVYLFFLHQIQSIGVIDPHLLLSYVFAVYL